MMINAGLKAVYRGKAYHRLQNGIYSSGDSLTIIRG
jgi:hypothetical protein